MMTVPRIDRSIALYQRLEGDHVELDGASVVSRSYQDPVLTESLVDSLDDGYLFMFAVCGEVARRTTLPNFVDQRALAEKKEAHQPRVSRLEP